MSGASWDDRQEGWWLASNGRWYAPQQYPRKWSRSALPPAPHHADGPVEYEFTRGDAGVRPPDDVVTHSVDHPHVVARSSTVREAAEATVTSQRTHASRLPAGSPPMPAIGSADPPPPSRPQPPGRIRDDAPQSPAPPDSVAGDFGRILGSARSRIEKAINDSSTNN